MSTTRKIRLRNGRHIATWHPVKEFNKNVRWRRGALFYSDRTDFFTAREFTDLWESDALIRRRGIVKPTDRAAVLGMDLGGLSTFDEKVRELEREIWKKAADFYQGMLESGIFNQTMVVYGGVYHAHRVWTWANVQAKFGVSRATVFRRIKSGAAAADLFKPAQTKAKAANLSLDGRTYRPIEFAATFSKQHVRDGMDRGLSPDQILKSSRRPRGRPRKHAVASHRIVIGEVKIPAEEIP